MSSGPPKFTFGEAPSTSSSSTPGLFGSSNPQGSNLFGGGNTGQSAGSGLFGGGDAGKSPGSGFSFAGFGASSAGENKPSNGATADNKTSGGLGGFSAGSVTSSFGGLAGTQTPPKPSFDAGSRSGLGEGKGFFGNVSTGGTSSSAPTVSTTPGPSGFSFKSSTTPAGPPPTNLFGGSAGGNNLFGNNGKDKSTINPFQPAGASIATGTTQPASSGGGLFDGDQTKKPHPKFSWGKPAGTSQGNNSATTTNSETQKPLFGSVGQVPSNTPLSITPSNESQKSLFGGLGQNIPNTPSSSAPTTSSATPSLFFPPPTSSAGSDQSKPFQFPSTAPSTAQTAPSDAGNSKSLFGATPSQTPSTSAPTFANLFHKTPTVTSVAPSANLFNLAGTTPATSGVQTLTSSAAPTTTTSAPFGSLFKIPDKPASCTTTSTSQPATTSTAPADPAATAGGTSSSLGASVLGASTAGPTPPAQSRLRNKTMDEILTRWASDLTKYTKEFQSQAEIIAYWDQLLVENMSKVSKLYISAVTAEKQTASVEMQLTAVENQQNELESWLTKYEGEVDEMLAKNGAGQGMELGGPDQERERTYKLAEKLSERLEDMGKDLGSMIEEINAANAGLSKTTKADEPITQIVRILNSHLSQLQAIDQSTVALQAKVNAAQKASQGLGFPGMNGSNGTGNGAAEDFYRSYLGRR